MNCRKCGKAMPAGNLFCENCGERTGMSPDENGVMSWIYEMNMWKNPTLVITIWKVLLLAAAFPAVLVFFLGVGDGFTAAAVSFLKVGGMIAAIVTGLMLIAYPIVAIINGGKYCVVFKMDEQGVNHIQMQKQFKKSQVLAMIGVVAGALTGNIQATASGLLAGSKQSTYSQFKKVKKVQVRKKRHVIYVNEAMVHNQIYAEPEIFDQVTAYIIEHAKKAKITYK